MKWIIAGGSGYIGKAVSTYLSHLGFQVVILSRSNSEDYENVSFHKWSGADHHEIISVLEGADVVLNLAGESVDARYTPSVKERLYDSRLIPTQTLGKAMTHCVQPPRTWLQMSTATIYADSMGEPWDEYGDLGSGFSVDLAAKWERTFVDHLPAETRGVLLRTSIVLGRDGGAYPQFRTLARFGIRGFGSRNVKFSWIHEYDLKRVLVYLAKTEDCKGVYNLAAEPCTIREFLSNSASRQASYPLVNLPEWMIEIGAFFLRTESELLLKSRNVRSSRLADEKFEFRYPVYEAALKELEERPDKSGEMRTKYDWQL
ncbi:MAG: DUF1731 domain-containing protein [Bacteroidetes bacterium]|nr:MAG: DUF1731 domain-containing protein [Bacteroidota bacterium]